jgi:hypothetical protein
MPNKKSKPGRKPGSKIVFYSKKEDDFIKSLLSNGKSNKENSEIAAKKLKRPVLSIAQRIVKFKKEMGLARHTVRTRETKVEELRRVVLPKNIALEFEASRAVLKENRIVIYFK